MATTPSPYLSLEMLNTALPLRHPSNPFLVKTASFARKPVVRARCSRLPESHESDKENGSTALQEDLKYLVKLGAGSIAGAAAIKYGSIIFPEITRPNLTEALLIISIPVLVSIMLLIRQSRAAD